MERHLLGFSGANSEIEQIFKSSDRKGKYDMDLMTRQASLMKLQKKLLIFTAITLIIILWFLYTKFDDDDGKTSYIVLLLLSFGLVGGFVSIQQRIHNISDDELVNLSASWASILLVPIYGAIFAVVLHLMFVAEMVTGVFFPSYEIAELIEYPTTREDQLKNFRAFFCNAFPESGKDTAKMLFWAFCAGFSERLVPQIIKNFETQASEEGKGVSK